MNKLFFDIETLPAEAEKHEILKEIHQKRVDDGKRVEEDFEDYLKATNLENGVFKIKTGKILEVDNPDNAWFYN